MSLACTLFICALFLIAECWNAAGTSQQCSCGSAEFPLLVNGFAATLFTAGKVLSHEHPGAR